MNEALVYVGKFLGQCVRKSKGLWNASVLAIASVAEVLLESCPTLVGDIRRFKENSFKRAEAETAARQAETQKKLTAAAEAANKATTSAHEEALRALERERESIKNRKLAAEATAAEAKAEKSKADAAKAKAKALESLIEVYDEARKKNIGAAEKELLDALRQYNLKGGKLYIDSENLKALLKLKDKPDEPAE